MPYKFAICILILLFGKSMAFDFGRNLLSSSSSICRSCIENTSQKWCVSRYSSSNQGECCSTSDTSGYCYGQSSYVCSNDDDIEGTAGTNNYGGYILCPSYSSDCGSLSKSFYYNGQSSTFEKNYIPSSVVCVYQVTSSSISANGLKIEVKNATGVDINVYTSSSSYNYDKEGSMYWNDTKTVSLSTSTDVYIMVHPTSFFNGVEIDVESVKTYSEIAEVALVFVIIGSICCFMIIMGCIIFGVIYCVAKGAQGSINNQGRANNMAVAVVNNDIPPPIYQNPPPAPNQPGYMIHQPQMMYIDPNTNQNIAYDPNNAMQPQMGIPSNNQPGMEPVMVGNPIAPVQPPENKLG
ncbi:unnamed protein product [Moneuplotes crassus]|uniref:CUB domain-containing protein n=1 Tax=Euplotes crassus TaxID=5936 RepID=A0AAD1U7W6_EUPCR|nr:unnamed protein product [Moneuplotes crassus]